MFGASLLFREKQDELRARGSLPRGRTSSCTVARQEATGVFFYTSKTQQDIIIRKKEIYDGAQPSGNSIMACNLYKLGLYFDENVWQERSFKIIRSMGNTIVRYPTSFGFWDCLMQEIVEGTNEIAIISTDFNRTLTEVLKKYIPHKIIMSGTDGSNSFPLLSGRENTGKVTVYLCRNYTCEKPVSSVSELLDLIKRK